MTEVRAAPEPPPRRDVDLSLVVPVFNIRNYLADLLNSINNQTVLGFEVVFVDDGSTDGSGEVIRAFPFRSGIDINIVSQRNVGLGPARWVGLQQAVGRYVWFVDGDDWISRTAVARIGRVIRLREPDAVYFPHAVYDEMGHSFQVPTNWRIRNGRTDLRTALAKMFPTAWTKVFKKDRIKDLAPFPPTKHEDWYTSYYLSAAPKIWCVDRVLYAYRVGRPGSIMGNGGQDKEAVTRVLKGIISLTDSGPHRSLYRDFVAGRAIKAKLDPLHDIRLTVDAAEAFAEPRRRPGPVRRRMKRLQEWIGHILLQPETARVRRDLEQSRRAFLST